MSDDPVAWSDHALEALLGRVLQIGVFTAAAVVIVGGVLYVARHGHELASYRVFLGEPHELRTVRGIVANARGASGRGIIQLGILILIATPVARVALSLAGFVRVRDWLYVVIALIVLTLLLFSLRLA
jgi:uncharacterized membrane protein